MKFKKSDDQQTKNSKMGVRKKGVEEKLENVLLGCVVYTKKKIKKRGGLVWKCVGLYVVGCVRELTYPLPTWGTDELHSNSVWTRPQRLDATKRSSVSTQYSKEHQTITCTGLIFRFAIYEQWERWEQWKMIFTTQQNESIKRQKGVNIKIGI